MDEIVVTEEQRLGQIARWEATKKKAESDAHDKRVAELQSMSVADRLMRQHQSRSLLVTREDEGGIFGFHVRQITGMEREAIYSLSNMEAPKDDQAAAEYATKLYQDIRDRAAGVVITPDVKEYISSGASPDSFNMWVLTQTMMKSAQALEVVKSFREDGDGAGSLQHLSDNK